jgi:NAD(P)-dependent dehydrogenase (short-subunit alcohol dehydrogenase family)
MTARISLVTGAASGLGRATALAMARRGDRLVLCDRTAPELDETAFLVREAGGEALAVVLDITRPGAIDAAVAAARAMGGLDYAVNSAGIEGARAPMANYAWEDWRRVLAVNLDGVFLSMKSQIPAMMDRGGGAIVNVGSTASFGGVETMPAYTASKHALLGLTRAAALDYAPFNIRINAICPGSFRTPMSERLFGPDMSAMAQATPMKRLGSLEEIAAGVLFLCSDASTFITGAALPVEGGKRAR